MVNEKRLIDVNKLRGLKYEKVKFSDYREGWNDAIDTICTETFLPSVDATEVVHGRWIIKSKEIRPFEHVAVAECSECHAETESKRSLYISSFSMDMADEIVSREAKNMGLGNYCPNCGAKMDK